MTRRPRHSNTIDGADGRPSRESRFGPGPSNWVLVPGFVVLAFLMTFRDPSRLTTSIVGDNGDAVFVMWVIGWVQHAVPQGWDALWNANIFHPAGNTLAYSESLIPVAAAHWVLQSVLGTALAMNVLYLGAWTGSLWITYRLALRLGAIWPAAILAACMFSFSTPRLARVGSFQLVLAFLIPAVVLLVIRVFDRASVGRGVALGAVLALLALDSSYYGVLMGSATVVLAGVLLLRTPAPARRSVLISLGAAGATALVLAGPVALQYAKQQQDPAFRRGFEFQYAAHPGDFLAPGSGNYLVNDIGPIARRAEGRTIENRLFPGFIAVIVGTFGSVVLLRRFLRRRRRRRDPADDNHDIDDSAPDVPADDVPADDDVGTGSRFGLLALVITGGVFLVLSFGDWTVIAGHRVPLPYALVRHLPGFAGIRVTARFVVLPMLALSIVGAVGLSVALERSTRRAVLAVTFALSALVIVESAQAIPFVTLPTAGQFGSANRYLETRPPGAVLELPINPPQSGLGWAFVESPRMNMSLIDGYPRVNGYSGFFPPRYPGDAQQLATFPATGALARADRLGVRYVIIRWRTVGHFSGDVEALMDSNGVARYTRAEARRRLRDIPASRVASTATVEGAYVVTLAPPRASSATASRNPA